MLEIFEDKRIEWSDTKNDILIKERSISFEDVSQAIEDEQILDIIEHPNKKAYSNQKIIIIEIDDYTCAVPFVYDDEKIFLKTIYKSRKLKKHYEKQ